MPDDADAGVTVKHRRKFRRGQFGPVRETGLPGALRTVAMAVDSDQIGAPPRAAVTPVISFPLADQ